MNRFLRILLYLTILLNCIPDAFAARFRVSDEYVTVFAEPERITNLGRAYRGEVYESEGTDGSMFVFTFHGRKAYIASYCCEMVDEGSSVTAADGDGSSQQSQTSVAQRQPASEPVAEGRESVEPLQENNMDNRIEYVEESGDGAASGAHMPGWITGIISLMMLLGIAVGLWSLFGPKSCENFFDSLAGTRVTWCSKATYFRPLIFVFVAGAAFGVTHNFYVAFALPVAYEIILLCMRAKKLGGLRPAVVEAFFLLFHGIGYLIFCWLFLAAVFLAGGSSKGSNSKKSATSTTVVGDAAIMLPALPATNALFIATPSILTITAKHSKDSKKRSRVHEPYFFFLLLDSLCRKIIRRDYSEATAMRWVIDASSPPLVETVAR